MSQLERVSEKKEKTSPPQYSDEFSSKKSPPSGVKVGESNSISSSNSLQSYDAITDPSVGSPVLHSEKPFFESFTESSAFPSVTSSLLPLFLLMLSLVAFALWVSKRVKRRVFSWKTGQPLAVLNCIKVGPKEQIALVRADQKFLVVGITSHSVRLLTELPSLQQKLSDREGFEKDEMSTSD